MPTQLGSTHREESRRTDGNLSTVRAHELNGLHFSHGDVDLIKVKEVCLMMLVVWET